VATEVRSGLGTIRPMNPTGGSLSTEICK